MIKMCEAKDVIKYFLSLRCCTYLVEPRKELPVFLQSDTISTKMFLPHFNYLASRTPFVSACNFGDYS